MNEKLFEAVMEHNMEDTYRNMLIPRRIYGGGIEEYSVNLLNGALDYENLLVRTDVWMNNLLSFDGFTDEINKVFKDYVSEHGHTFDYVLFDLLEEKGYGLKEVISGYTYNDPDFCRLDRDIHYTTFFNYDTSEYYAIILIHYGADARVGFSDAVCFKVEDIDYFFHSMEVTGYLDTEDSNDDYQSYEIEEVATFNKEKNAWYHNETGKEMYVYSSADGW